MLDSSESRAKTAIRFAAGQQLAVPGTDVVQASRNEGGWDHDDETHQQLLMRPREHNADIPKEEQFFANIVADE